MIVEFEIQQDMNEAIIDIQQAIEEVKSELPLGAEAVSYTHLTLPTSR